MALLASKTALRTGLRVESLVKDENARSTFVCLPIAPSVLMPSVEVEDVKTQQDNEDRPSVVIFTSGTTGPPKVGSQL